MPQEKPDVIECLSRRVSMAGFVAWPEHVTAAHVPVTLRRLEDDASSLVVPAHDDAWPPAPAVRVTPDDGSFFFVDLRPGHWRVEAQCKRLERGRCVAYAASVDVSLPAPAAQADDARVEPAYVALSLVPSLPMTRDPNRRRPGPATIERN
jgi:hypothetical protein